MLYFELPSPNDVFHCKGLSSVTALPITAGQEQNWCEPEIVPSFQMSFDQHPALTTFDYDALIEGKSMPQDIDRVQMDRLLRGIRNAADGGYLGKKIWEVHANQIIVNVFLLDSLGRTKKIEFAILASHIFFIRHDDGASDDSILTGHFCSFKVGMALNWNRPLTGTSALTTDGSTASHSSSVRQIIVHDSRNSQRVRIHGSDCTHNEE